MGSAARRRGAGLRARSPTSSWHLTHLAADAARSAATRQHSRRLRRQQRPRSRGLRGEPGAPRGQHDRGHLLRRRADREAARAVQGRGAWASGASRSYASAVPVAARQGGLYPRRRPPRRRPCRLETLVFEASGGDDFERKFDEMAAWKADALYIMPTVVFAYEAQRIADLARWHRLPTMHWYKPFAALGGLMAYGVDYPTLQRHAAVYVDKFLKGSHPFDLPIEQPTHYQLVINRDTANELGLAIPQSIALRADRIIE